MKKTETSNERFNKGIFAKVLITFLICLLFTDLYAQFGGGGGSSSSGSSGGDGIGELIFYLIMMLPFPFNLIAIGILLVGFFVYNKLRKQGSILNKIPASNIPGNHNYKQIRVFKQINPNFEETKFLKKVEKAFFDLQKAWSDKNISLARRYISDGMYQRVNTQFKMMDILDQTNPLEKLTLNKLVIDKIESDGNFDVIHVGVFATIKNRYISNKYSNLNQVINEQFVEYWTFIRRLGVEEKDIYNTYSCPNCGGQLPLDSGEISKCPFCGTITNSGEYDWVLSEITQADDYVTTNYLHDLSQNLANKLDNIFYSDENFSTQLIEDKVSNGYLQVETAKVYQNSDIMKRFVSDEFLSKIKLEMQNSERFVYNRIYLNDVTLIGALQKDGNNILAVYVKCSFQRVRPESGKASILDYAVMSKQDVVLIARDINFTENKGSIYSFQCSSCGGSLTDTANVYCPFCGSLLNSFKHEWIIIDIMSNHDYVNYYKQNANLFISNISNSKIDKLMKVRDYAFNNVLVMIAADGVFDNEEMKFANKLAKKYGYSTKKVDGMIDLAVNNKLSIKMPESLKDREKVFKIMRKAAAIDGNISPEEQAILDNVKDQYL